MKLVSYAGQQLVTTEDVADALVILAAEIANEGGSQALQIPIVVGGEEDLAELVVGVGNDVLVGPHASDGDDPDFSEHAERLRSHPFYPKRSKADDDGDDDGGDWSVDFDLDTGVARP